MAQSSAGLGVITGGGSGIGRATALALALAGRAVALVDRDAVRADDAVSQIRAAGGTADRWVGDVSDPGLASRVLKEAAEKFGVITDLVNCAAIRIPGRITDIDFDQWRTSFAVGLDGMFFFCKAAIPLMAANGGGSIVNVSSPSAYGRRKLVAYSAVKAAVNVLSSCLAADHLDDAIRVNVVIPPFTETPMTEGYPAEKMAVVRAQAPGGKLATPEDIAELIVFLSSPAGTSFTGGVFGSIPTPAF